MKSQSTSTFPISLLQQTVFAPAFRSPTTCRRISLPCSTTICTNSTRTSSLNLSNYTGLSASSTNHFRSSPPSLKLQCHSSRPPCFSPVLRTCLPHLLTYTTSTNNSPQKSKYYNPTNVNATIFRIKMAQLTNKCSDDDLEYYIKECGDILGVSSNISNPDDPKAILHYIFQEIIKYKSSNLS